MKFGDKLTQLRKRNGLSQEELGEKLNVTRQTVSKWELGQSKPDTDKLMEISKLLNVDFNTLADDTLVIEGFKPNNVVDSDEVRPRKWLLVLLIIFAIAIVIVLANKFITDKKEKNENKSSIFDFFGIFETIEEQIGNQNKDSFNRDYESKAGTKWGNIVSDLLDDVIKNNKTNKEHIITVIFEDLNSSDPNLIKESKKKLDEWADYEVSLDYDDDGFVYMITIEYLEDEKDTNNDITTNNTNTQTNTESNINNNNSSNIQSNNGSNTNSNNGNSSTNNNTNNNSNNNSESNSYSEFEKKSFNMSFESLDGKNKGTFVRLLLEQVISSNKNNSNHIVKVIYNDTNTSDENEIRNIKNSIDTWTDYEVTLDYDGNGYVYAVTIK